jgi:nitrogenase-stabilizing/protective protein
MDDTLTLEDAMDELSSAEDFLDYFGVPYDPSVVHVNRLHILQRFHDYLAKQMPQVPEDEAEARAQYTQWLTRAYEDFVDSSAQAEKVFAVFQTTPNPEGGSTSFVSLDKVFRS